MKAAFHENLTTKKYLIFLVILVSRLGLEPRTP